MVIENCDDLSKYSEITINSLIIASDLDNKLRKLIDTFNINHKLFLNQISIFDKGLEDEKYKKGIKYPYSYVRWDFKENLNFFLYLIEKNYINIDFLELDLITVDSIEDLNNKIKVTKKNSLILFKISH